MTNSHFHSLLDALQEVRSDLSSRLERIEERLREVEAFQHKAEALNSSGKDSSIALRWKIGILVSAVGILVSLTIKILEAM
jgi:tetrahydromethanopterin S-methyltransferase subunit G